jgi:tetratricopeptide (TPR) repeat protein
MTMRNALARALCRLAAVAAAALAVYDYAWMPEHADHILKSLTLRTQAALQMEGDRAVFMARDNLARLQPVERAGKLSVDYHLICAVNDRIIGRNDEAIEQYTAALAADHRPEIYFDRGVTYLKEGNLDAATADIALAVRFNSEYLNDVDAGMQERVAALNKAVPYNPPPR